MGDKVLTWSTVDRGLVGRSPTPREAADADEGG